MDEPRQTLETQLEELRGITDKGAIIAALAARIVEMLDLGVIIIDEHGVIRYANAKAETIFRYEGNALLGLGIEALVPETLRSAHAAHRRQFFANPRPRTMAAGQRFRGRQRDGNEIELDVSLTPVVWREIMLVVAIVRIRPDGSADTAAAAPVRHE